MGLLADYPEGYEKKPRPQYLDRGGDYLGSEGSSDTILKRYDATGAGGWATLYTVPSGKVFKLRRAWGGGLNSDIRVNGVTLTYANETLDLEVPISYPAGTLFEGHNTTPGSVMRIYGVEETETINRERNFI